MNPAAALILVVGLAVGAPPEVLPPGVPADDVTVREDDGPSRTLAQVVELLGPVSRSAAPVIKPLDPASPQAEDVRKRAARGAEALAQGKPLKAVPDFEAAVAIDPADPELLRSLAQAYSQVGNEARALEAYERLLILRPDDPQALVATGVASAARRSYEEAVRRLAAGLDASEKGTGSGRVLPLASRILAERALGGVLRELAFDDASIEASTRALASLDSLDASLVGEAPGERPDTSRLRAEILLARADAQARRGRPDDALRDLQAITALPGADPNIVLARELLLLERAGRASEAEARLAKSLSESKGPPSLRDVELVEWLVARQAARPVLAEAARSRASAPPASLAGARLLAAIDPAAGERALEALVADHPRNDEAWLRLLRAKAAGDAAALATAVIDGAAKHPEAGAVIVRAALGAGVSERALRQALQALPPSPDRSAALARLQVLGRDFGPAWTALVEARRTAPAHPGLALAQVETAAALEEPVLLDALERGAAGSADGLPDHPSIAPAVALARRSAGDLKGARTALEGLAGATPPAGGAEVAAALAALLADEAAPMRPDDPARVELAQRARALAERARQADPDDADAALVLLRLRDPRIGALADAEAWASLRSELRRSSLAWLDERVTAEEEIARGRVDQGLARLRALADARPFDGDIVGLAVSMQARAGHAADALQWLDQALAAQPGLVCLRDARLSARAAAGQGDAMVDELEKAVADDSGDALAAWHLEALLRAVGRQDEAVTRSRERIRARPEGPRRALELANLEQRAGRLAEALGAIEAIGDGVPLSNAQRLAAVEIVSRLPSSIPGRNERLVELAEAGLDSDDAERVVYAAAAAAGVMDEARDGTRAEQAEALVRVRAFGDKAAKPRGADGRDGSQVLRWRDSAQLLVDAEAPAAAAELLRARLAVSDGLSPAEQRVLQSAAFACDAAAKGRSAQAMALLSELRDRGQRPFGWTRGGAESNADALLALSSLFTVVGDREGSERILEALLKESPTHAMARNNLAWSRVERGAVDDATVALAEQAAADAPTEAAILDTLGWIRYLHGQLGDDEATGRKGAVSLLRRSAELGVDDPSLEVLDHLGDALWRSGDRDGALDAWRRVGRVYRERFDRAQAMGQIGNYLLSETGVRLVDPARFYELHFETPANRAAKKLAEAEQGKEPSVAPLLGTATARSGE